MTRYQKMTSKGFDEHIRFFFRHHGSSSTAVAVGGTGAKWRDVVEWSWICWAVCFGGRTLEAADRKIRGRAGDPYRVWVSRSLSVGFR